MNAVSRVVVAACLSLASVASAASMAIVAHELELVRSKGRVWKHSDVVVNANDCIVQRGDDSSPDDSPPIKGNLLPNSSFETGLGRGWLLIVPHERRDEASESLRPPAGGVVRARLDLSKGKSGIFRAVIWIDGQDGSDEEVACAVVPRPQREGPDPASMIGVHALASDFQYTVLKKLGVNDTSAKGFREKLVLPALAEVWNTEAGAWCLGFYQGPNSEFRGAGELVWPCQEAWRYYRGFDFEATRVAQNFLHSIGNGFTRYFYMRLAGSAVPYGRQPVYVEGCNGLSVEELKESLRQGVIHEVADKTAPWISLSESPRGTHRLRSARLRWMAIDTAAVPLSLVHHDAMLYSYRLLGHLPEWTPWSA